MKVVAIAVGSYGDVAPFIVLGKYMKERGHSFGVAAFEDFRKNIEAEGLDFYPMYGSLNTMLSSMLANSDNSTDSGMSGIRNMLDNSQAIYNSYDRALKNAEVVIYMQFAELAYHFAEKYGLICVRSYVYPNDPTPQFNALISKSKENSRITKFYYVMCDYFMNSASRKCANEIRKKLGLGKLHFYTNLKKMRKQHILTLYQYSPVLASKYKGWKEYIHVTGPWYEDDCDYIPSQEIIDFVENKEMPIYIGFGSMNYEKLDVLGELLRSAVLKSNLRAVMASNLNPGQKYGNDDQIIYVDYVPFKWLFGKVRAVVQHGGSGTIHYSLRNAKPTFVMSFGADQYFWGRRVHHVGCGPYPLDVKEDDLTEDVLVKKLKELICEDYTCNAKLVQEQMRCENGVEKAYQLIEEEYKRAERN